jgi:dipeptidyl aminopeptidase/acylaminoacyl peptidase
LPPNYEAGKRYPLVTIIHGGPAGGFTIGFAPQLSAIPVPLTMDVYFPQLFAEHGYAVFMPNIRGGGGYGESFRNANVSDWGGADFDDVMTGIDALIAQGIADPDKLAIVGWSYGGYMTAWAISQTTRFRAASVGAGVSDLTSMYGTCEAPDQIEPYFAGPPWQQTLYQARSAITFASHIKTPTLIQHGERDTAVPVEQARELYRALSEQKVPVELTIYPRSGHGPEEPRQTIDIWTRNLEWLDRWVMRNGE